MMGLGGSFFFGLLGVGFAGLGFIFFFSDGGFGIGELDCSCRHCGRPHRAFPRSIQSSGVDSPAMISEV